ncbi:MAG TPA: hypothetical protein VGW77_28895, partial [Candidatus Binatia bacterium]|nr:hypothetical protein [Candidatus Binatia bacterium]
RMVGSGFEQEHDPLAGRKIEVEEAAEPSHNRRANGDHPKADSGPAPGLPLRVPSSGQTDCIVPQGIQSGGNSIRNAGACPSRYATVGGSQLPAGGIK